MREHSVRRVPPQTSRASFLCHHGTPNPNALGCDRPAPSRPAANSFVWLISGKHFNTGFAQRCLIPRSCSERWLRDLPVRIGAQAKGSRKIQHQKPIVLSTAMPPGDPDSRTQVQGTNFQIKKGKAVTMSSRGARPRAEGRPGLTHSPAPLVEPRTQMGNRGTEMLCSQRRPGRPGFRHGSAHARRNIIRMGAASPPPTQQRHVQPSEHLKVRDSFATQHVPVQAHADLSKSPAPGAHCPARLSSHP